MDDVTVLYSGVKNVNHLMTLVALFIDELKPALNTKDEYKSHILGAVHMEKNTPPDRDEKVDRDLGFLKKLSFFSNRVHMEKHSSRLGKISLLFTEISHRRGENFPCERKLKITPSRLEKFLLSI